MFAGALGRWWWPAGAKEVGAGRGGEGVSSGDGAGGVVGKVGEGCDEKGKGEVGGWDGGGGGATAAEEEEGAGEIWGGGCWSDGERRFVDWLREG